MITNTLSVQGLTLQNYSQNQLNGITANRNAEMLSRENFYQEADKVSLSYNNATFLTYNSSMLTEGSGGDGFDLLRGLVLNIFKDQGVEFQSPANEKKIDFNEISTEEARSLIEKDGYFGVEQTSSRIVDFAIGLSGDDPSRLEALKQGVENGFQEALDAFGGWLPEISYDTFNAVMKKIDIWAGITNSSEA